VHPSPGDPLTAGRGGLDVMCVRRAVLGVLRSRCERACALLLTETKV